MAQPMTKRGGPMKKAQLTLVRMQGPMPMIVPFQNELNDIKSATGMEKATVHAKKILTIQVVMRLVCFTHTWCAWWGGERHAKDMPAMKQPHKWVPSKCVIME
mmetsp:Transcript_244/g.671  ORF Transcript_244/g.671 Transcript_244/m.671 type:complete len:103 (-) Transcript_244:320-628(-)